MDLLKQVEALWPLIGQAPWLFLLLGVAIFGAGWLAARTFYSERMATMREQLNAYKDRLAGASPDQAADRIASLEKRLDNNIFYTVPIEDVRRFGEKEAGARHKLIAKLVSEYRVSNDDNTPSVEWINARLGELKKGWRVVDKETHWETADTAVWG